MRKLLLLSCFITALAADAHAGNFRARAREHFETGTVDFADGRGSLAHGGLLSALDFWYEEPFRKAYGLTVHRGRLNRVASDDNAAQTVIGLEAKYFPIGKDLPLFFRGGTIAAALDPAGSGPAAWTYGVSTGVGWEFPVWKLGLAPELGGKFLWGARGRRYTALTIGIGVHFYTFPGDGE
jgi:hypothetical protein